MELNVEYIILIDFLMMQRLDIVPSRNYVYAYISLIVNLSIT